MNDIVNDTPTPPQAPPVEVPEAAMNNQAPMDEFEGGIGFRGAKNSLKLVKLSAISLGGLFLVLIVVMVGVNIYNQQHQPVTTIATATPEQSPTESVKPQVSLPPEYTELNNKIGEYDKSVSDVPETRTRLNYPPMSFEA